ncbi:MAG TPA: NUDIX hydrolase [Jatrophihabitantaceae bacterium]|nr:NUDIX hydrolase [Jatrophihabitantaceae bacterium]
MVEPTIRAAGGVVWRDDGGPLRIAVIHRDRYDDWSLPKGKLNHGESRLSAAVREVHEETGAVVAATRRLIETAYLVDDVPKTVQFWAMRYRSGEFTRNSEVDDLRWLPLPEARTTLTHDVDRSVLDAFAARPVPQSVIVLLRHAKAGRRTQWQGDDRLRPLDKAGRLQARELPAFLSAFTPVSVVSADRVRCVQTLEPFAVATGMDLAISPAFSDESYLDDPEATRNELLALAKSLPAAVVCSQGIAVPGLVTDLTGLEDTRARKGAAWVLSFADGAVVSADYYDNAPL